MKKRLSKETTERIEGCGITINTQLFLKNQITDALNSMLREGWEHIDVKEYLYDLVDTIVDSRKAEDDKETVARMNTIGRKVVIIDETGTQNNVTIKTISDFELKASSICFEEDEYRTYFYSKDGAERFLEGRKAYIHDGEVSIQLVN